jgi:hypothetical protein
MGDLGVERTFAALDQDEFAGQGSGASGGVGQGSAGRQGLSRHNGQVRREGNVAKRWTKLHLQKQQKMNIQTNTR